MPFSGSCLCGAVGYEFEAEPAIVVNCHCAACRKATGSAVAVEWGARPARPREMTTDWVFGSSPAWWSAEISLEDGIRRCWDALADEGSRT